MKIPKRIIALSLYLLIPSLVIIFGIIAVELSLISEFISLKENSSFLENLNQYVSPLVNIICAIGFLKGRDIFRKIYPSYCILLLIYSATEDMPKKTLQEINNLPISISPQIIFYIGLFTQALIIAGLIAILYSKKSSKWFKQGSIQKQNDQIEHQS